MAIVLKQVDAYAHTSEARPIEVTSEVLCDNVEPIENRIANKI